MYGKIWPSFRNSPADCMRIHLQTLDFISNVIAQDDWPSLVPSLDQAFPGHRIGGWKAGRHFLRIDGATSAGDRGDRISQFNENSVRLFLISSRAGGVGINLCSASRVSRPSFVVADLGALPQKESSLLCTFQVILFDSSFNPSVDMQAVSTFVCSGCAQALREKLTLHRSHSSYIVATGMGKSEMSLHIGF